MRAISLRFNATSLSAIKSALVLAVGMGFGRFAFMAIYPHMVEEDLPSLQGASLAASANSAGCMLAAFPVRRPCCVQVMPARIFS